MEDLTGPGRERVDRLPLLVSGQNIVKLLSIPKLHDGTAVTITNALLTAWMNDCVGLIRSRSSNTTASNTGIRVESAIC